MNRGMKTKYLIAVLTILTLTVIGYLIIPKNKVTTIPDRTVKPSLDFKNNSRQQEGRTDTRRVKDSKNFKEDSFAASSTGFLLEDIKSSLDPNSDSDFLAFLKMLEATSQSSKQEEILRNALTKWAGFDGPAAANWAKARQGYRHFLPEILQTWAGINEDSAVAAWTLAKIELATDGDEDVWLSENFVTTAFGEMTGVLGEDVWAEMAALPGQSSVAAMIGMADFASNRQQNTEFASDMEARVLGYGSPALAAAFYAGGGHITAAKSELTSVTDRSQWQKIVREIARQQAITEPAAAISWLQSQFNDPNEAISDMVESIGMMHALNAGDVLQWLATLPESEARNVSREQIQKYFPELNTSAAD